MPGRPGELERRPTGSIAHLRDALEGDVNSTPDFTRPSQVMNGASDLFVHLLGEAGRHTRMVVGVSALPCDVAVEVEGAFEVG